MSLSDMPGKIDVILVDHGDNEIGRMEKLEAHQNGGHLHRAISVAVFNSKGETMLQRRALTKYHAAGLWANTTCSHPYPGEAVIDAAHRRLKEEMGFDCELKEVFSFEYTADVGKGLTEHEYDHVFFGKYEGPVKPSAEEVAEWKWMPLKALREDMAARPGIYAPWFRIMLDRAISTAIEGGWGKA